ncbi:hypothetical protein FF100_25575 [Methylobacterium terricola]|uniref:Uncharacterized protein n=1 Tax=Methylobacterium terricola TaxID=2583531 RepID=A0A5C4LB34_9HYPH|nr:hypothetical protein [Methylobacterium terricola]TNC09588.1 hypothetical protein FF100_25575 [Methylobacterium terricola]
MRAILAAGIVVAFLLPAQASAQAAQTTVGPGGLRLPKVIAGQPPVPPAGSDGAVAAPVEIESLADSFDRPPSAAAEPPPNPLFTDRPAPARR